MPLASGSRRSSSTTSGACSAANCRPCDAVETAECWQLALKDETRPSVLALTRQKLKPARIAYSDENLCARGAYEMILMAFERGELDRIRPFLSDDVEASFAPLGLINDVPLLVLSFTRPTLFDRPARLLACLPAFLTETRHGGEGRHQRIDLREVGKQAAGLTCSPTPH